MYGRIYSPINLQSVFAVVYDSTANLGFINFWVNLRPSSGMNSHETIDCSGLKWTAISVDCIASVLNGLASLSRPIRMLIEAGRARGGPCVRIYCPPISQLCQSGLRTFRGLCGQCLKVDGKPNTVFIAALAGTLQLWAKTQTSLY